MCVCVCVCVYLSALQPNSEFCSQNSVFLKKGREKKMCKCKCLNQAIISQMLRCARMVNQVRKGLFTVLYASILLSKSYCKAEGKNNQARHGAVLKMSCLEIYLFQVWQQLSLNLSQCIEVIGSGSPTAGLSKLILLNKLIYWRCYNVSCSGCKYTHTHTNSLNRYSIQQIVYFCQLLFVMFMISIT